jgi:hypothetical protein
MRITTRRWAPDGPPVAARRISILTPPLYKAGHPYLLLARPLTGGATVQRTSNADAAGRLRIDVDGSGHQVSIVGPGTGAQPPLLLPTTTKDVLRVRPGRETALPIRIWNPRGAPLGDIRVELSTEYPTVRLLAKSTAIESIAPGATADLSSRFQAVFTGGGNDFAPARISLKLTYDGWLSRTEDVDVLTVPDDLPTPLAIEVLDGRTMKFPVFRQKGNQGGGGPLERTVTEGKGNGNGVLEPGEEATVWVKLARGLDPFDRGNWYRAKVYTDSPWLEEIADIAEPKQREWTGAKERTSLVRLAPDIPRDVAIPVILANESWSFHYTPDVRYGRERLYQAFQLHRRHLHRYEFPVVNRARGATAK